MLSTQVTIFLQVAESGSFSKASQKLFVSPTAIMKQMDLFENHVGTPLFTRTPRGVTLTPAGLSLYSDAKKMKHFSEQALQRIQKTRENIVHVIRVGNSLLRPCDALISEWSRIRHLYPEFRLQITQLDDTRSDKMFNMSLLGDTMDFIVTSFDSNFASKKFSFLQLGTCLFCCSVSWHHPLVKKETISFQDLYGETLMMAPRGDHPLADSIRDQIETMHPQIHLIDSPIFYTLDTYNYCESHNYLLLTSDIGKSIYPSMKSIPLSTSVTIPYGLLYQHSPQKHVQDFIRILSSHLDSD